MGLDHFADRSQQTRHIAPTHPLPTLGIEHRLQFVNHEADVTTPPEYSADHARQGHRPGIMLEVSRIDEDLERAAAAVVFDVVDRDVDGVVAAGPLELVGEAR